MWAVTIVSAGGTGTYDINHWATEIQAGSYLLMDTAYGQLGLPFAQALSVLATVISVSADWAVADCGLKALGMDHGNPSIEGGSVHFCSDEHVTFAPDGPVRVGDRVRRHPRPHRSDRRLPRSAVHRRRRRRHGHAARRPARLVGADRRPSFQTEATARSQAAISVASPAAPGWFCRLHDQPTNTAAIDSPTHSRAAGGPSR